MSDSKTVHSIVKINGGAAGAVEDESMLLQRELYIADNGYLYVGNSDGDTPASAQKINSSLADVATKSRSLETNLLTVSNTGTSATLGLFTVENRTGDSPPATHIKSGDFYISSTGEISEPAIREGTIQNSILSNIQSISTGTLIVKTLNYGSSYGDILPDDGEEGQLFFLIPSGD